MMNKAMKREVAAGLGICAAGNFRGACSLIEREEDKVGQTKDSHQAEGI
jgi:uncharacterized protein (UPF0254 family)